MVSMRVRGTAGPQCAVHGGTPPTVTNEADTRNYHTAAVLFVRVMTTVCSEVPTHV